jgi:hypothetical protein
MLTTLVVSFLVALVWASSSSNAQSTATRSAFERLKALEGDWVDVDGAFGKKGAVAVTYRVTGGGTAVVETFPAGTPAEMVTVYHADGPDLVLTHYCSAGNQPRMRAAAPAPAASVLAFEFDGGMNVDPSTTSHMHSARLEFVSDNEIRATWQNWSGGKPDHSATFRVVRKTR